MLRGARRRPVHTARITPVHPASDGITTRTIRELVYVALAALPQLTDPHARRVVRAEGLGSYDRAIRDIHFPADQATLAAAVERLKFDELFTLELGVAFRKHRVAAEQARCVASDAGRAHRSSRRDASVRAHRRAAASDRRDR